jgi:hypothetical protein
MKIRKKIKEQKRKEYGNAAKNKIGVTNYVIHRNRGGGWVCHTYV